MSAKGYEISFEIAFQRFPIDETFRGWTRYSLLL